MGKEIVAADLLDDSVIVVFRDGSGGIYTAELLKRHLGEALPLATAGDGEDEPGPGRRGIHVTKR